MKAGELAGIDTYAMWLSAELCARVQDVRVTVTAMKLPVRRMTMRGLSLYLSHVIATQKKPPIALFGLPPSVILRSWRTGFSGFVAEFISPFLDIACEHGENMSVPQDIQNSQSRGSSTDDLDNGRRRYQSDYPLASVLKGGRNYRFT